MRNFRQIDYTFTSRGCYTDHVNRKILKYIVKSMETLTETLTEMVGVAEHYCKLIEGLADDSDQWLAALYQLMPRLHSAVTLLNTYNTGDLQISGVDLDERFELYSRLRKRLGERDSYWLEFDATPEEMHMSGSLADDLTDIYFDLQHGLTIDGSGLAASCRTGLAIQLSLALGTASGGCRTPSVCPQGAQPACH